MKYENSMYGDYITVNGLMSDNEVMIEPLKTIIQEKVKRFMKENGVDVDNYDGKHVIKQLWRDRNLQRVSDEKQEESDVASFSVGWKATRKIEANKEG